MAHWAFHSVFYHMYPLGLCGAPARNDFSSPPFPRLEKIVEWGRHARGLGANALYLGPLFESATHGYDTADYFHLDRRLGADTLLREVTGALHAQGHRFIFDGVFNHVGRDFWAFKDLQQKREASRFAGWFQDLRFGPGNPCGDPFTYATWQGHWDLVKLDLRHPEVKSHLFEAVASWIREYDLDGLRLDAAECMDKLFLRDLAAWCRSLKPDFWLMGEVIHGDYRQWAKPGVLDAVTNYEAYKGLFSCLNDRNYFEMAHSLSRQFGERGLYADLPLYAFADNHDVNRIASVLKNSRWLYPLYCLLFTMPGVPSVYYGSEWGITGERIPGTDTPLRPALALETAAPNAPHPDLPAVLRRLADLRLAHPALQIGKYRQVSVSGEQMAFVRSTDAEKILVLLNASEAPARVEVKIPEWTGKRATDLLNPGDVFELFPGRSCLDIPPCWARVCAVA
jgi:glycosidase